MPDTFKDSLVTPAMPYKNMKTRGMPRVTTLNTYYTFFRLVVWVAVQESNIESKTAAMSSLRPP